MMLGAWIRKTAFWTLDFLNGGKKRANYNDIKKTNGTVRRDKLIALLNYAVKHVPAYRDVPDITLDAFPVLSKQKVRSLGENNFLSEEFLGENLHQVFTSGSTGTPFRVVQDAGKRRRVICDLLHAHQLVGWRLGDRYVFIRNWVSNYRQSKLKAFTQNVHNINVTGFDDKKKEELWQYLKKHSRTILFGYASAINEFAFYVKRQARDGKELKIRLIVCDSDELSRESRLGLERTFGCTVINRYDNEENGLLGISRPGDDTIYLNTASLYFELLALDSDEPVSPGEIGRVVVTDLYNRAMPLIRYDLGDLAISVDEPGQIKTLKALAGRAAGCLTNIQGRLVSNVTISGAMEPFVDIERYQVCQNSGSEYRVSYMGTLSEFEYKELEKRLYDCFGSSAHIQIIKVDSLPLGKNGKFQTTVNNQKVS